MIMPVAFIMHPDCIQHGAGISHPENASRLTVIQDRLIENQLEPLLRYYEAPLVDRQLLYAAHATEYVDSMFNAAPNEGAIWLDPDTVMTPGSLNAALRAAGANTLAIDLLMTQQATQVFCSVRPPGHHAEFERAMGFCLFNNIAVGAKYAQQKYAVERIAIIDFDVHHGNGTEDIFYNDSSILFCSLFQHPFYPNKGADTASDHIINIPLEAGTTGTTYREIFATDCIPTIDAFKPQLILVSAGFDAHIEDNLADLCLTDSDYAWLASEIKNMANRLCDGKIAFTLEGGYALPALARSVAAVIKVLVT